MSWVYLMVATMYLYISLAAALSVNIDDDIPQYIQKIWMPIPNGLYKLMRIAWAILSCLIMYPVFWIGIALWVVAYLRKRFWVYFYYGSIR